MRKVVIIGPPPVQILDVTGPLEVFSNAPGYEIQLANPGLERTLQTNRGVMLGAARTSGAVLPAATAAQSVLASNISANGDLDLAAITPFVVAQRAERLGAN